MRSRMVSCGSFSMSLVNVCNPRLPRDLPSWRARLASEELTDMNHACDDQPRECTFVTPIDREGGAEHGNGVALTKRIIADRHTYAHDIEPLREPVGREHLQFVIGPQMRIIEREPADGSLAEPAGRPRYLASELGFTRANEYLPHLHMQSTEIFHR